MKISVIIPVYNSQAYLSECVRSITSQSYRDLEVLLVDDGSTDGSGDLCDVLAAEARSIRAYLAYPFIVWIGQAAALGECV